MALLAGMIPGWALVPFGAYLLALAIVPTLFGRLWGSPRTQWALALGFSLPVAAVLLGLRESSLLLESLGEYAAFLALVASLFVVSGGIHVRGTLPVRPLVNASILGLGAVLASLIGTTGASMLLIRPLLRANEGRRKKTHLAVFFIFIVANCGGLLTPLGDPPLFLGFLRGVPFFWTLRLAGPWALVNGVLLLLFAGVDRAVLERERRGSAGFPPPDRPGNPASYGLGGGLNVLWLLGIVAVNLLVGHLGQIHHWGDGLRRLLLVVGLGVMGGLSWATTSPETRQANRFTWRPIREVAAVFLGIFVTMGPALEFMQDLGRSGRIRMEHPWEFFWAAGMLSSVLDNAPTYLTFASLASGVVGRLHQETLDPSRLGQLLGYPEGLRFLVAISCGSVFMGANTYIGNGPNFIVKAIAEEEGVTMPGFFGYLVWAGAILIPLYLGLTLLFFRS